MHEDFVEMLTAKAHTAAKNADERLSFEVRIPGITFPGIEVFWGNHLARVDPKRVDYNRGNKKLDDFTDHIIRSLKGKSILPRKTDIYRVQDVLRERYYSLVAFLATWNVKEAKRITDMVRDEVARIEAKLGQGLSDSAAYRVRLRVLEDELRDLLPKKRGRKPKTEKEETSA